MSTREIANLITQTLKEHRATRDSLAQALIELLEPLPAGTKLQAGPHTISIHKVFCGCSQWSNRKWDLTGSEIGYLVDGQLIRDEDPSIWDGNNHHYRRTPLYRDRNGEGESLKLASAKTLRALALALPAALAAYIEGKKVDAVATEAARVALVGAK